MAERYQQEGKSKLEGVWKFLAIGLTIGVVLALINDAILTRT